MSPRGHLALLVELPLACREHWRNMGSGVKSMSWFVVVEITRTLKKM